MTGTEEEMGGKGERQVCRARGVDFNWDLGLRIWFALSLCKHNPFVFCLLLSIGNLLINSVIEYETLLLII